MPALQFRKQIFFVIIIAVLFRFGFLLFGDILPVMWDARRYAGASIALISYIDDSGDTPFRTPLEDRKRFKHYTDKYIQGEQIEWLKYKPFSLTEARNEIFIGGPLYPFITSLIIYLSPIADFTVIRIVNMLFDLLAVLLVMLVAMRLIGKKGAIITGILYALYFPFTLLTSMVLLESSTTLLILLSIYYLMRGYEDDHKKYYIIAGITTGLLILNKPTAMLLSVPFILSFIWYARQKLTGRLMFNRLLLFFTPFILITICWAGIASMKYGELTFRDPSYKEANLRQSSNITFEGYDLDKVEKGFWDYSISEHILSDPAGYVGLLAKKFERMWSKSANEFKKSYLLPANVWEVIHLLLVLTGLFGLILLLLNNSRAAVWILLIILYYTSIHLIFHSVSRYSFNALPLLFIASSYFFIKVYEMLKSTHPQKRKLLLALLGLLFVIVWKVDFINSIFHLPMSQLLVSIYLLISIIIVFFSLFSISNLLTENRSLMQRLLLPVISSIVLIVCSYSTVLSRNAWSEFSCRLSNQSMKAGSRIYIDNLKLTKSNEMLAVLIDLNSGADRKNSFTVTISDFAQEYIGGKPPLSDLFYPKPTYKFYSQFEPIGIEQFRQYAIIPVEFELVNKQLTKSGYLDISVAINERFSEDNNYINIFGNFDTGESEHYIPGIRFTSIERYVHRGDPRIRYRMNYLSKKVISYYIKRNSDNVDLSTDLSPSLGVQSGRYNIFLVHFFPNGEFIVY